MKHAFFHPFTHLTLPLLVAVALLTAGCGPSQEELDAERARVQELNDQLQQSQTERDELTARLSQVDDRNRSLADRLRALGEDVEELEGDRASLQNSLTETQRALEQLRERERQAQARLQTFRGMLGRFREMIQAGQLRVRIRGNRMVVEIAEGILFDSARSEVKPEGREALAQVAEILAAIPNRQFQVAGHTDNVPIRSRRFPSNWELSTARAVNVTRFLVESGMPAARLSAAGYAETEPVGSNDTDEGRAQNRRIEIVLVPNLDELPDLSSLEDEGEEPSP